MLIRELLERTARHRAVELRLFALVGRWAADAGDPALRRTLAAEALHHAWRASMWDAVVPVLHDVPAAPGDEPLLEVLAPPSVARLLGVLDGIVTRYEEDLAAVNEVSDAPAARVLQLVLLDTRADRVALGSCA